MRTATALHPLPLDLWAARRIGTSPEALTRHAISAYHLRAVRETVARARRSSAFYARQLATLLPEWPGTLDEFSQAPLTSPGDLVAHGFEFLSVSQSEVSRIVTLETSGTTGARKRIFFTAADHELALDFFASGVAMMSTPGDRMLITLPGEREGSVGFQLARGIERAGVEPIPYGLITDPEAVLARMNQQRATMLIGLPVQVLALTLQSGESARRALQRLHTIVLCSDHVPQALVNRIRQRTGCAIFEHYGSTEMGLGGGVDCPAHAGYHLREADLYFEIVSPRTAQPVADGQMGEVVFTTLGRLGMPLIRYRTGDQARILPGPCSCGSALRRMERVCDRVDADVSLAPAGAITISALDEALFAIPSVADFTAAFRAGAPHELEVRVYAPGTNESILAETERALLHLPAIARSCLRGALHLCLHVQPQPFPITGAKRKIEIQPTA